MSRRHFTYSEQHSTTSFGLACSSNRLTRFHLVTRHKERWNRGRRKDPDRVASGYSTSIPSSVRNFIVNFVPEEAVLSNPNATRSGGRHVEEELREMVRKEVI